MIGRKEIAFSNSQIEKARARVAYQLELVGNLLPETAPAIASVSRHLLKSMSERLALLIDRHETLVASSAAEQMLDEQTDLVASMVVGDARKPEARRLLDQMHDNASAGNQL